MIEWGTIVVAVLGSVGIGEIINLLTVREQKKGLKIENKQKEDSRWETLLNEVQEQNNKLQEQNTMLHERLDKKDERIFELEDRCGDLRAKLDEATTALAKASLLKCNRLNCDKRRPPLGYTELSPAELIAEGYVDKME